jgi:hypothetical protein
MTHALAISELAGEEIEALPSRETLALFNLANVTATNLALAINTATFASSANAVAGQAIFVVQS